MTCNSDPRYSCAICAFCILCELVSLRRRWRFHGIGSCTRAGVYLHASTHATWPAGNHCVLHCVCQGLRARERIGLVVRPEGPARSHFIEGRKGCSYYFQSFMLFGIVSVRACMFVFGRGCVLMCACGCVPCFGRFAYVFLCFSVSMSASLRLFGYVHVLVGMAGAFWQLPSKLPRAFFRPRGALVGPCAVGPKPFGTALELATSCRSSTNRWYSVVASRGVVWRCLQERPLSRGSFGSPWLQLVFVDFVWFWSNSGPPPWSPGCREKFFKAPGDRRSG